MSKHKPYPDLRRVDELVDAALIADGLLVRDHDGNPDLDEDGDRIPDHAAFLERVRVDVLALPMSTSTKKAPDGAFHAILVRVLPQLKVDNFASMEEERAYTKLLSKISRYCNSGVDGDIQRALGDEGKGRVLCRGKIATKSGRVNGVWISDSASPTGPIAAQFEEKLREWTKSAAPVLAWGDMAVTRQPKLAKTAIAALESHRRQVQAALEAFKTKALTAGATPDEDESGSDNEAA